MQGEKAKPSNQNCMTYVQNIIPPSSQCLETPTGHFGTPTHTCEAPAQGSHENAVRPKRSAQDTQSMTPRAPKTSCGKTWPTRELSFSHYKTHISREKSRHTNTQMHWTRNPGASHYNFKTDHSTKTYCDNSYTKNYYYHDTCTFGSLTSCNLILDPKTHNKYNEILYTKG